MAACSPQAPAAQNLPAEERGQTGLDKSDLIIRSALSRHESRGLHYTLDYPDLLPEAKDTVLVP